MRTDRHKYKRRLLGGGLKKVWQEKHRSKEYRVAPKVLGLYKDNVTNLTGVDLPLRKVHKNERKGGAIQDRISHALSNLRIGRIGKQIKGGCVGTL